MINKTPVSPRNNSHPSTKLGVSALTATKDARNNSASSPRPTSQGAIKPEVGNHLVPTGEVGLAGATPGYLAMNYSSQIRAASNQPAPATKKQAWIPSSQYQGPPINRIPRDTNKALEQRMLIQSERDKLKAAAAPSTL